ncbi:MAG: AGE family epimerase/isomerase [Muribaculaceae bacterium]|nr:AGE family epimerase/isomerase [Muribaculaceae bacterium]
MTEKFKYELISNLTENILPYWMEKMKDPRGGYYGRRDGNDNLDKDAPKGAILQARILWTFSAAYNSLGNPEYLAEAHHAYNFIRDHFIDKKNGGAYWSVTADGEPLDTKKQFYAIAFIIYGLSEYYIASGDRNALLTAFKLFESIEDHARDRVKDGYIEATTRDWNPIEDMRLSERDANASKTMNTHLHILEGYTNLLHALRKANANGEECVSDTMIEQVTEATVYLLRIFLDRIENPKTHHLTLFFDDDWNKFDDGESYGHDIEASWLLLETAMAIGDDKLIAETLEHTYLIALAALKGRREDGSMVYELHADGSLDTDRHWWVQAEDVIGQLYLARYHTDQDAEAESLYWLDSAYESWRYIADNLVDPAGEWFWSIKADGTINREDDKAGFWKCPYHNSRMCLESIRVLESFKEVV